MLHLSHWIPEVEYDVKGNRPRMRVGGTFKRLSPRLLGRGFAVRAWGPGIVSLRLSGQLSYAFFAVSYSLR